MLDGAFAPWHILIVGLIIVVVFGSKRLPESARAIGQSMRILKSEVSAGASESVTEPPAVQTYVGQAVYDAEGRRVELPPTA